MKKIRGLFNRWRRQFWHILFYRMVFGEKDVAGNMLPYTRIAPSTCIVGESAMRLGDHVFIGQFNFIEATAGLDIGEGVQITNFVSIVTHSSHRAIRLLGHQYVAHGGESPGYVKAPVSIGAYSFIGPHSLIEPGAQIGRGALICAYSQVRSAVPDFAIMAGQPARQIGDVRQRDVALLAKYPELAEHYQAWAGELPSGQELGRLP